MSSGIFSEGTASPHTSVYSLKHTTCTFWTKEINIFGELFGCHGKESWTPSSACKWPENYKRMCFTFCCLKQAIEKATYAGTFLVPSVTLVPLLDSSDLICVTQTIPIKFHNIKLKIHLNILVWLTYFLTLEWMNTCWMHMSTPHPRIADDHLGEWVKSSIYIAFHVFKLRSAQNG